MTNKNTIAEATQKVLHKGYQPADGALRAMSRYAVTVEYRERGLGTVALNHIQRSLTDTFGLESHSLETIGMDEENRTIDFDLLVETGKLVDLPYSINNLKRGRSTVNSNEEIVRYAFEDHTQESIPFFGRPIDWIPIKVEYRGTAIFSLVEEQHPETQKP